MNNHLFPHFSRFITAQPPHAMLATALTMLTWPALFLFIVTGAVYVANEQPTQLKLRLQKKPFNATAHLDTAKHYQLINNPKREDEEVRLATWLVGQKDQQDNLQVLGEATWEQKYLSEAKESSQKTKEQIKYWEDFVGKSPFYRDGFLMLAQLYLQEGNHNKALKHLERAKQLDPNLEAIKDFEALFED